MPEPSAELLVEIQNLVLIIYGIMFLIWVAFAYFIRSAFLTIEKDNRLIPADQAWLLAIPFFNIYWNFYVTKSLAGSLNNEFFDRKIAVEEMPTLQSGSIYSWSFLAIFFPILPGPIRYLAMLVCIVYFIVYCVQVSKNRNLILEHKRWKEDQQQ